MPLFMRKKSWSGKWQFVAALWLLWVVIAAWLAVHPIFLLTPLLAVLTHLLLHTSSTVQPTIPTDSAPALSPPLDLITTGSTLNLKHDLLTPIRLIMSFCDVLTNATLHKQPESFLTETINAIRRNAQTLESFVMTLTLSPVNHSDTPETGQIALEPLLNEALALTVDLMANRSITADLTIIAPLPPLRLDRNYVLQAILNILRGIAQPTTQSPTADKLSILSIVAKIHEHTVQISFTGSVGRIQQAAEHSSWAITKHLIEKQSGQLWLENDSTVGSADGSITATIVLALPVADSVLEMAPLAPDAIQPHPEHHGAHRQSIIIFADHKPIMDLFHQLTTTYNIMVVSDVDELVAEKFRIPERLLGVILTRETDISSEITHRQIADLVGGQVPVIECNLPRPERQLEALHATYLAKPIEYDALMGILEKFDLTDHNILIIDDNADTTTMLARMLTSMPHKYSTRTVHTATTATTLLQALDHKIGAVMVDVSLPDMDGVQWIKHMRSDKRFLHIPVILMSAHPTLEFMLYMDSTQRISIFRQNGFEIETLAPTIERLLNGFGSATS